MIRTRINVDDFQDIEKSLLEEKFRRVRRTYLAIIIAFAMMIFAPHGFIIFLTYYLRNRKAYLEVKDLLEKGLEEELLKNVKFHFGLNHYEDSLFEYSLYALVDLRNLDVASIILNKYQSIELVKRQYLIVDKGSLREALDVLALKLRFKSREELIAKLGE